MREIKFRAWDRIWKNMFKVGVMESLEDNFVIDKVIGQIYVNGEWSTHILNSFTLMQFTGLKDKNGKEIFEGDIVQTEKLVDKTLFKTQDVIVWSDERMGFEFKEIRSTTFISLPIDEVKVIGNIYENPELLEEKK